MAALSFPDGDVLIDDEDLERLGDRTVYIGTNGYPYFSTEATGPVLLHLFVMGGPFPGRHVDHRLGNKRDCRKAELRVVSYQINQVNRRNLNANNTSGARGVIYRAKGSRWIAQIMVGRRGIYLGSFDDRDAAVAARRAAEIAYFGEECPCA